MAGLIKLLKQFNRKERFFLVGQALDNEGFRLSDCFREKLADAIGLKEEIPCDAFAAMDYHLDWVAGSLWAYLHLDCETFPKTDKTSRVTQRDVDLIIAFKAEGYHHIIFIEAKGYNSWDNAQMHLKADRLKNIFGQHGEKYCNVEPHFCLASLKPPQGLKIQDWPKWMKKDDTQKQDCAWPYYWMKLDLPSPRSIVTSSCDSKKDCQETKDHFHIVQKNYSG